MARDVEANLTASDRTGSAVASAERRFKQASDRIQRNVDKVNDSLNRLGLKKIDLKADPRQALREIDKTERRLRELSAKSATVEVKIHTEKALSDLAQFRRQLSKGIEDIAPKATQSLTEVLTAVAPILAGIAAAVAPVIGATISGAVIGGAGIGGVIGGLLLVKDDVRVASAGKALGERLLGSLRNDAAVFIDPVLKAIDTIGAAFDRQEPHLRNIFVNASKFVQPLTEGLTGFLDPVIEEFDQLVAKAAPVIDAVKQGLVQVGDAVGDVFKSLSDNGREAGLAITIIFEGVAAAIRIVGAIINGLTEAFGFLIDVANKLGFLSDAGKAHLESMKQATDAAAGSTGNLTDKFVAAIEPGNQQAQTLADIEQAARDLDAANRTLYGSQTSAAQAIADATAKIKDNGKALSLNTQKGRDNRKALEDVAGALTTNYQNYVKVNGVGAASEGVADRNRAAFIKLAQKAGYAAGAAEDLATELGLIPGKKTTQIVANTHDAQGRIAALKAQLNSLHDRVVRIIIKRTGDVHVSGPGGSGTQLKGAATAMWQASAAGGSYRIGGPRQLSATVENTIFLDGSPFRAYTDSVALAERRRADYRRRVGAR
jgi:hypothetical protein